MNATNTSITLDSSYISHMSPHSGHQQNQPLLCALLAGIWPGVGLFNPGSCLTSPSLLTSEYVCLRWFSSSSCSLASRPLIFSINSLLTKRKWFSVRAFLALVTSFCFLACHSALSNLLILQVSHRRISILPLEGSSHYTTLNPMTSFQNSQIVLLWDSFTWTAGLPAHSWNQNSALHTH